MATAAVKLEQGDAGVEATEVEEVGGEQAKGSNGSTEAPSKNAGRKRRRATLATLQTIYAAPGRFYLNNPRAQEQLETLVIAHLSKLHDEGFTRATLCSAAKCELCQWNSAPLCSLCGLKFVRASAATGGAAGSRAFPLYIPKFSDDDGSQSLHIEVSLLCSDACIDKMMKRPLKEASWKRLVRGFAKPLFQGNVIRQWFFLALSLYTLLWTSAFRSFTSFDTYCLLTTWNLVAQILFYGLCCLASLFAACGCGRVESAARRLTSLAFNVAFVIAVVTMSVFWMVSFIDEELVFPKNFDQPDFLNVMQHTLPAFYMLIEMITVCHIMHDPLLELILGMVTPAAYIGLVHAAHSGWLGPSFKLAAMPHPWLEVFTAEAADRAAAMGPGHEQHPDASGMAALILYTLCAGSLAHWGFRKLRAHWWKGKERNY